MLVVSFDVCMWHAAAQITTTHLDIHVHPSLSYELSACCAHAHAPKFHDQCGHSLSLPLCVHRDLVFTHLLLTPLAGIETELTCVIMRACCLASSFSSMTFSISCLYSSSFSAKRSWSTERRRSNPCSGHHCHAHARHVYVHVMRCVHVRVTDEAA